MQTEAGGRAALATLWIHILALGSEFSSPATCASGVQFKSRKEFAARLRRGRAGLSSGCLSEAPCGATDRQPERLCSFSPRLKNSGSS